MKLNGKKMRTKLVLFLLVAALVLVGTYSAGCQDVGYDCMRRRESSRLYDEYADYFAKSDEIGPGEDKLTVKFLGTNSIFITDGQSNLMIDPYFTRPNIWTLGICFAKVSPDRSIIKKTLECAGIKRLDAILMTHAHYDHALDIAEVSKLIEEENANKYPKLFGSESIRMVGLGGGLSEKDIEVVTAGRRYEGGGLGRFKVTFLDAAHMTIFGSVPFSGRIKKPLTPPCRVASYKVGKIYAILIEHPFGKILNLGSANYRANSLDGIDADYLLLGIGGFDTQSAKSKNKFYEGVVVNTRPKRILFTHWDDYNIRLDKPVEWLKPLNPLGGFSCPPKSLRFFNAKNPKIRVDFLPIWEDIDLRPMGN